MLVVQRRFLIRQAGDATSWLAVSEARHAWKEWKPATFVGEGCKDACIQQRPKPLCEGLHASQCALHHALRTDLHSAHVPHAQLAPGRGQAQACSSLSLSKWQTKSRCLSQLAVWAQQYLTLPAAAQRCAPALTRSCGLR